MGESNLIDRNLQITKDESKDEAWVNTNGTFWRGSLSQLREFLELDKTEGEERTNGEKTDCTCD